MLTPEEMARNYENARRAARNSTSETVSTRSGRRVFSELWKWALIGAIIYAGYGANGLMKNQKNNNESDRNAKTDPQIEHVVESTPRTPMEVYHDANSGTREVVDDATDTFGSVEKFLYGVSDVLDAAGSVENAHLRTAAEREKLKRQKETDRARTEREKIRNANMRQTLRERENRERQRQLDAEARRQKEIRKEAEQRAAKAAAAKKEAQKAAQRLADAQRKKAAQLAKK